MDNFNAISQSISAARQNLNDYEKAKEIRDSQAKFGKVVAEEEERRKQEGAKETMLNFLLKLPNQKEILKTNINKLVYCLLPLCHWAAYYPLQGSSLPGGQVVGMDLQDKDGGYGVEGKTGSSVEAVMLFLQPAPYGGTRDLGMQCGGVHAPYYWCILFLCPGG